MDAPREHAPVYLDNAATSFPKPPEVVAAVRACLDQSLTVQRSTHRAPFRGDEVLRRCRVKLARLLGAASPEEIVYAYSATDALNIALSGMVRSGGHVLTSPLEHHSVMRPLHHFARTRGISFEALPADEYGIVEVSAIERLRLPETCLVVINWISNVSGTVQPIAEIGAECHRLGIPYLIDASQGTGAHPLDVRAVHCDACAQPAHKALLSLPGLGVLYVRAGLALEPWRIGGTGYRSELIEQPTERPMAFEAGTPNVPAIVGLDAALDWLASRGISNIADHGNALVRQLWSGLAEVPGLRLIGPAPHMGHDRGFVVSFTLDDPRGGPADPLVVSAILADQFGISSRAGLHCAPTAHRYFGTFARGGTVRLSVGAMSTPQEIDHAVSSLKQLAADL